MTEVKGKTSKDIFKAYRITNTVNGKIYIGITSGSLKRRWAAHIGAAKRGAISAISRAIAKYGLDKFTFEHVASAIDWSSLQLLEQVLIHQHGSFRGHGYNKTLGGEGSLGGGNPIEVDGDVYPSLSIAVEAFGLGQSAVYLRIHKLGWSVEQAFELAPPPISPAAKGVEVDGVFYESITNAAREFRLSERQVNSRLWHGWSIEEAFNLKDRRDTEKKKSLIAGGKRYASIAEFARQHNVDPKLTRQRVYLYGWMGYPLSSTRPF